MRENVASGAIRFRKAYIHSVVDRIEIDEDVIRVVATSRRWNGRLRVGSWRPAVFADVYRVV
jgi:hypothetical protein